MYGRTPEDDLLAAEREKKAVSMRLEGHDFDAIAEACGYSDRSGAYKAWKRALKRVPQETVEEAREAMRKRLDSYRMALAKQKYGKNGPRAVEALTKIEEREARLFGLDRANEAERNATPYSKHITLHTAEPSESLQEAS